MLKWKIHDWVLRLALNLAKNSEGYILHNLTLETNAEAMCDNEPMCIILAPHKKVGKEK